MGSTESSAPQHERDAADLKQFGYEQELHRSLGLFSSFATAFSYISPSTGIFTLFFLALGTAGGIMFWTWPVVAIGQLFVAFGTGEPSFRDERGPPRSSRGIARRHTSARRQPRPVPL